MSAVDIGTAFYEAVQRKATTFLGSVVKAPLYPVDYPAQGDFKWYWQNTNNVFNQGTYDFISGLVGPGDISGNIKLGASSSFPNAYAQVVTALTYSLSTANMSKLNTARQNAETQGSAVVDTYQGIYGTITDDQMKAADVTNKLDYVISYILGSKWSGATPPLSWQTMKNARNLAKLLPNMPASGEQVLPTVTVYLNILAPVLSLQDQLNQGLWIRNQMVDHAQTPTASNGGMKVVNPATGLVDPNDTVGYAIPKSLSDISNSLTNDKNGFSIGMSVSRASGSSLSVHVDGSAGFSVGSLLRFSVGASASYDMTEVKGASANLTVSMDYRGATVVPIQPTAWDAARNVGWYYADPIAQAVANGKKDVDGFKFAGDAPPFNFGGIDKGGNFGQLKALVVSQFPTVKLTYTQADFKSFKEAWSEHVSGNLTLFGFIKLGSFNQGAYGSSFQQGADNSTFSVTFSPSPQVLSVPQLQQLSYVVAGAVTNPGA